MKKRAETAAANVIAELVYLRVREAVHVGQLLLFQEELTHALETARGQDDASSDAEALLDAAWARVHADWCLLRAAEGEDAACALCAALDVPAAHLCIDEGSPP